MDQERAWIEQALEGDRSAFGHLVRAYERPVYNLTYRMLGSPTEAEDAAQETFLRAYNKLASYDPRRKFVNWLLSIASHHCIDRLRRRKRAPQLSLEEPLPPQWLASDSEPPDQVVDRKRDRERVRMVLETLPPDYRAAVVLRHSCRSCDPQPEHRTYCWWPDEGLSCDPWQIVESGPLRQRRNARAKAGLRLPAQEEQQRRDLHAGRRGQRQR